MSSPVIGAKLGLRRADDIGRMPIVRRTDPLVRTYSYAVERSTQRPLELILARNLLSTLSTPAFLVNQPGDIVFYNEAAGMLLGRRFEENGAMSAGDWLEAFGPFDEDGNAIPLERQPLTNALRQNRPGHARHRIRSLAGDAEHLVEVSGVPVIGNDGFLGAMIFMWQAEEPAS
jgi:PAS domain-containing protein